MNKLILKFIWKSKETRIVETVVKKKTVGESKFNPYQWWCDISERIAHKSIK